MRVFVGTAGLLLALAACGQAADQGGQAASAPGSTSGSPSPTIVEPPSVSVPAPPITELPPPLPGPTGTKVPEGATLLPKSQVDTSGLPSYYTERNVWSLNGGRSLVVPGMGRDACTGVQARVVEQNADLVRIEISPMDVPQGGQPDGGGFCAQVVTPRMVTVDLKVPLGNRKVVLIGS
jgi:hypothetical protein